MVIGAGVDQLMVGVVLPGFGLVGVEGVEAPPHDIRVAQVEIKTAIEIRKRKDCLLRNIAPQKGQACMACRGRSNGLGRNCPD